MEECLICHNECHTGSWYFIETMPGKYTVKNTIYVCEKCNANINLEELKQLMLHNKIQSSIDLKLYIMENKISRIRRLTC